MSQKVNVTLKRRVLEKRQLSQDGICHTWQMYQEGNCPRKAIVLEGHLYLVANVSEGQMLP